MWEWNGALHFICVNSSCHLPVWGTFPLRLSCFVVADVGYYNSDCHIAGANKDAMTREALSHVQLSAIWSRRAVRKTIWFLRSSSSRWPAGEKPCQLVDITLTLRADLDAQQSARWTDNVSLYDPVHTASWLQSWYPIALCLVHLIQNFWRKWHVGIEIAWWMNSPSG